MITVRHIAQVCREAMQSFQESLGDSTDRHWESLNDRQRRLSMHLVQYILDNPNTSPMRLHEVWVHAMYNEGFVFGDLDEIHKTHPNIQEWEDLPQHVQTCYAMSIGIVRGMRDISLIVRGEPWSMPEVPYMTGQEEFAVSQTDGGLTVEEIAALRESSPSDALFTSQPSPASEEPSTGPSKYEET